jgi:hypothetical protein
MTAVFAGNFTLIRLSELSSAIPFENLVFFQPDQATITLLITSKLSLKFYAFVEACERTSLEKLKRKRSNPRTNIRKQHGSVRGNARPHIQSYLPLMRVYQEFTLVNLPLFPIELRVQQPLNVLQGTRGMLHLHWQVTKTNR